jgi:branched-chain amino acid transport system substrate-binding protein
MNKVVKKILPLIAALLFAVPAHADVTIGLLGPLSGEKATFGEQLKNGTAQAVIDINAAGGVLGQKLKLEEVDDACDPKQSVTGVNQLISRNVKYVIGSFCSAATIPASKVIIDEKAVLVSPAATNPKLTDEGGPGVFRVCGRDDQQGQVVADLLLKEFHGKSVAIIHDKSAWGKGLAEVTQKNITAGGMKETIYESYNPGEKDYSALVTLLKQKNIDVAFIGGYHTEVALIVRQLRAAGAKTQIIGGDALASNEFWSIAGPAAEGVLMTFGPDPRKNPEAQGAVKALTAKNVDASGYTLYTYAAVQVIAQAVDQAGSNDPIKVNEALHKGQFKTVLGNLSFDAKGDVKAPTYVIYKWHNGTFTER